MADDVLINKAATIERCVTRVREEYAKGPVTFPMDFTRQDSAILNIQRACEATLDMGQHVIRREKLGVPHKVRAMYLRCWRRAAGSIPCLLISLNAWWAFATLLCTTIRRCN